MDEKFKQMIEGLPLAFEKLVTMPPVRDPPLNIPSQGVYLFSENGQHLYVGRSNTMRKRYQYHTRPGATHNQASFALKLAAETCKMPPPSYREGDGQKDRLANNPEYAAAFIEAKARVKAMDYRFVQEDHQTKQTLLEAYAIIALETPYNDFDTH